MKRTIIIGFLVLVSFLMIKCNGTATNFGDAKNTPQESTDSILNLYGCAFRQNPSIPDESELIELANFGIVIWDIELSDNNVVLQYKNLNPNGLTGVYVNPQDIFISSYSSRPWQTAIRDDLLANYDDPTNHNSFFLYNTTHNVKQKYWLSPEMYLMNLSTYCPQINGHNYKEYILAKIVDKIFTNNPYADEIDFIVVDNAIRDYAWMSNLGYVSSLDANWNHLNDLSEQIGNPFTSHINVAWRNGIEAIITGIKVAGNVEVIGNQPNDYFPGLVGKQFEGIAGGLPGPPGFNGGALTQNPADALEIIELFLIPNGFENNIIQASTFTQPSEELAETAIVIAMLNDFNAVTFQFNTTWKPDSALIIPGRPLGQAYTDGVFRVREFANCWIVFNTSNNDSTINLAEVGTLVPSFAGKIIQK